MGESDKIVVFESKKVAKRGARVTGKARKDTEKELGQSIITRQNYHQLEDKRRKKK